MASRVQPSRAREKPRQIADELRGLIVSGKLSEGDSLGRVPELVERFGVSRPSLREALRILETEGLVSVVRGMLGGVVVHEPDRRTTGRTAAVVLQARNVPLADVFHARTLFEPIAVGIVASLPSRQAAVAELRRLVKDQRRVVLEADSYPLVNARFHERLVALAGNQTLTIVVEMLNEVVARALPAIGRAGISLDSVDSRRKSIRSQERLVSLIENGKVAEAEAHWRRHLAAVGSFLLGKNGNKTLADLNNHP
jgi:DNA-binding FadR family transcriptional regulator